MKAPVWKILDTTLYVLYVLSEERTNNKVHDTYTISEDLDCLYSGCI